MKMRKLIGVGILMVSFGLSTSAYAEEKTMEKVETKKNETVDSVKSTYRDAKDKSCEMIDGKMQCLGKKVKNKAKTMSDKTKTKANEIENKVD